MDLIAWEKLHVASLRYWAIRFTKIAIQIHMGLSYCRQRAPYNFRTVSFAAGLRYTGRLFGVVRAQPAYPFPGGDVMCLFWRISTAWVTTHQGWWSTQRLGSRLDQFLATVFSIDMEVVQILWYVFSTTFIATTVHCRKTVDEQQFNRFQCLVSNTA